MLRGLLAQIGQFVVDVRRDNRMRGPQHKAVRLEVLQGLAQHTLADPTYLASQLGEPVR